MALKFWLKKQQTTFFTTWIKHSREHERDHSLRNSISCLNEDSCSGPIGFQCLSCAFLKYSILFYFVSLLLFFIQPFALLHSLRLQLPFAVPRLCSPTLATFLSGSLSALLLKLVHLEVLAEGIKGQGGSLV